MDRKKETRATILTILIPVTERRQHKIIWEWLIRNSTAKGGDHLANLDHL